MGGEYDHQKYAYDFLRLGVFLFYYLHLPFDHSLIKNIQQLESRFPYPPEQQEVLPRGLGRKLSSRTLETSVLSEQGHLSYET